jgi:hypothetical protein
VPVVPAPLPYASQRPREAGWVRIVWNGMKPGDFARFRR